MKICFLADGGSSIATNWIRYFHERGHEVHLISSRPLGPEELPCARSYCVPLAFMGLLPPAKSGREAVPRPAPRPSKPSRGLRNGRIWAILSAVRMRLSAIELHRRVPEVRGLIERIAPDVVHAMRIPFEGIVAAKATPRGIPLLVSVWGNDFTLFAERIALIGIQTRRAMRRADALHCDCRRDVRLAEVWGFSETNPRRVLPGAGGIKTDLFRPGEADPTLRGQYDLPPRERVIINPRGYRPYVPLEPFLRSIRLVVDRCPDVVFICTGLEANPIAERLVVRLGIEANVRLLGQFGHARMADLFRLAAVSISPSLHDGTPNTLLESMACGCFPVAGDIESVREWIADGSNGLLFDPEDPAAIAGSLLRALGDDRLRDDAKVANLLAITERAEYGASMASAEAFYHEIVGAVRVGIGG